MTNGGVEKNEKNFNNRCFRTNWFRTNNEIEGNVMVHDNVIATDIQ